MTYNESMTLIIQWH